MSHFYFRCEINNGLVFCFGLIFVFGNDKRTSTLTQVKQKIHKPVDICGVLSYFGLHIRIQVVCRCCFVYLFVCCVRACVCFANPKGKRMQRTHDDDDEVEKAKIEAKISQQNFKQCRMGVRERRRRRRRRKATLKIMWIMDHIAIR